MGAVVQGRVRNLTDFGAFVEIEDGVDGLIHLSNMSWNRNVKHPSELLKKGQKIDAIVLALDPANRRLALGLKQLEPDPWREFLRQNSRGRYGSRQGDTRQASFGVFVELQEGIEGLCHVSEMATREGRRESPRMEVGSEHEFRVIRLSARERKIALSRRNRRLLRLLRSRWSPRARNPKDCQPWRKRYPPPASLLRTDPGGA